MPGKWFTRRRFLTAVGAASTLTDIPGIGSAHRGPHIDESGDYLTLENSRVAFSFDREQGALTQIYSKDHDRTFLDESRAGQSSWLIAFYHPDTHLFTTSHHADPRIQSTTTTSEAALTFQWETPGLGIADSDDPDAPFHGTVKMSVRLPANDLTARWRMQVTNNDDRAIQRLEFPMVQGIQPLADDDSDAVYIPINLGRRVPDPARQDYLPTARHPTGQGPMQFTVYLDDAAAIGLIARTTDTAGYMKAFGFDEEDGTTIGYLNQHLTPYQPGADVAAPYDVVFGVHDGDWMDACDTYRDWVDTEGWLDGEASRVPDRLYDRGTTYIHRSYKRPEVEGEVNETSFDDAEAMVSALQDRFGFPIGFHWGGWETQGQYGAGDFWPPYEGVELFQHMVETLQQRDIQVGPYWNPTHVGTHTTYWQHLSKTEQEQLPMTDRDGDPLGGENDIGLVWYETEITYDDWQAHINDVVDHLIDSGIKHINQDGIPWEWLPCWNDAHSHPPGKGGNWFQQGTKTYLASIHSRTTTAMNVSGEGIADFYLPEMTIAKFRDARAELHDNGIVRELDADITPMFPYTFGDYAIPFNSKGHISTHIDWRDLQRVQAGRSIAWGAQPMFMGMYEPVVPDEAYDDHIVAYYGRIGEAWTGYANRFIARGDMLGRPDIDRGTVHIQNQVYGLDLDFTVDAIMGRGWQSAEGDIGIVLTSVAADGEPRTVDLDVRDQPYDLPSDPLVYSVTNGQYQAVDGTTATLDLAPSDVGLIGVVPATPAARDALHRIEDAQQRGDGSSETLEEAKRAFDDHAYRDAERLADQAITETQATTTTTRDDLPTTRQPANVPPTGDPAFTPGIGVGVATLLAGAATTGYVLKRRLDDES